MPRGTVLPSSSKPDRSLWPTSWKFDEVPGVPPPGPTPTSPKATSGKASTRPSRNRATSRRRVIWLPPLCVALAFGRFIPREGEIGSGLSCLEDAGLRLDDLRQGPERDAVADDLRGRASEPLELRAKARVVAGEERADVLGSSRFARAVKPTRSAGVEREAGHTSVVYVLADGDITWPSLMAHPRAVSTCPSPSRRLRGEEDPAAQSVKALRRYRMRAPVRRPTLVVRRAAQFGQARAVGVDGVDVVLAGRPADEDDLAAVGRPARGEAADRGRV